MARCGSVLSGIRRKDHAIPHDARQRWNSLQRNGAVDGQLCTAGLDTPTYRAAVDWGPIWNLTHQGNGRM
jgi:hypothetical protein